MLIARALAQDAPLLLADEPTAGLDPAHQISLTRLFGELAAEGRGVVASLHDLSLAARWCSRLILVDRGLIVADGAPRRGVDAMDNSYRLLDLTVYGRQEEFEDSPDDWPQHWGETNHPFRRDGRPISQWRRLEAGHSDDLGADDGQR